MRSLIYTPHSLYGFKYTGDVHRAAIINGIDEKTTRGLFLAMPAKLATTIAKIGSISNQTNAAIVEEFSRYLKGKGAPEGQINNSLKVAIVFARYLGPIIC